MEYVSLCPLVLIKLHSTVSHQLREESQLADKLSLPLLLLMVQRNLTIPDHSTTIICLLQYGIILHTIFCVCVRQAIFVGQI